ncbi:MAG TPA: aspartate aminotransferase family protein, partial [Cyclobacteriaceae bacterium]|nr:aspartate aminotransferase family protein [Cyclobacteriaceae bacterium]
NLICFRYRPKGLKDEDKLNQLNARLLEGLNKTGEILLTQTKLNDKYTIRFVSGNNNTSLEEVKKGWNKIVSHAKSLQL